MTSTEELCLDCGAPIPGGGFCRRCLRDRVRELELEWEGIENQALENHNREAADAGSK